MTADDVKSLLNIPLTDTSNDNYFNSMIPFYLDIANEIEHSAYTTDDMPSRFKLFIAKSCNYMSENASQTKEVASESMGPASVGYNTSANTTYRYGLPSYILSILKCKVSFI